MEKVKQDDVSTLTFDEIMQLIDKVSSSKLSEFKYESNGCCIELKKPRPKTVSPSVKAEAAEAVMVPVVQDQEEKEEAKADESDVYVVKSPIVGTFYASKEEGGEPLVKTGMQVKKDSIVGIIEAMKLMNEITAGADGVVQEILVENGQLVEYGQELMKIKF